MNGQEILNIVGGVLLTIVGWLSRQLWDAVAEIRKDVKDIEVHLPTFYVCKDDLKYIDARFDRLEDLIHSMKRGKE